MKIAKMSAELIDKMGSDLSVVNAARVSFAKEHKELQDNDPKLINYLAVHKHWTPFAHCFLSFRIKAPIFVARQLVKHQVGLAWNEVSRRYVDDEPEFWFPEVWRSKPVNAKQGSSGINDMVTPGGDLVEWAYSQTQEQLNLYNEMIGNDVAPEQARMILPQNTMTEWVWSGSLAAFARVCKLRLDPHAQQETQEIARQIYDAVPSEFQHSWKALME